MTTTEPTERDYLIYIRRIAREAQRRIVSEGASAEDALISLRHIENVITEALDA